MRLTLLLAATTASTAALLAVAMPPAVAAGGVRLAKVQYNSPGDDTGSNFSLNAEWVRITNHGAKARTLTGWTLRDASHHVFTFPTFHLGAGRTVTVHTGRGGDTRTDLYWNAGYYIWNNSGDTAILRNRSGVKIDSCAWGDGSGVVAC